jgi:hypothetical protein
MQMTKQFDVTAMNKEITVMARSRAVVAKKSTRDYVQMMKKSVEAALAAGYTHEDIAAKIREGGLKISAVTLKQYLRAPKTIQPIHDNTLQHDNLAASTEDTDL